MSSIQNRILKVFMRQLKQRAQHHWDSDLPQFRKDAEQVLRKLPVPQGTRFKSIHFADLSADWILPPQTLYPHKILVYLHGGAFVSGSIDSHRSLAARLAQKCGVRTISLNYRRAPEHPFPAALDDVHALLEHLTNTEHYAPQDIILSGDGAGANLVLSTLMRRRDAQLPQPMAGILISPLVDLTFSGRSMITKAHRDPILPSRDLFQTWAAAYIGNFDARHPLISPLYGNLDNLAPLFIQVATDEVLFSDAMRLMRRLEKSTTEATVDIWKDLPHGWHFAWQMLPEARQSIANIHDFVACCIDRAHMQLGLDLPKHWHPAKTWSEKSVLVAQTSVRAVQLGGKIIRGILQAD